MIELGKIPAMPQRQDALADQLADLRMVANRLGMYDAADAIRQWCDNLPVLKYGCHIDLEPGMEPDATCVMENGEPLHHCIYAKKNMRKEQCEYWKPI